eukprot:scaffold2277_cov256-Pinguiococcus_pyrenoidosus.AAC.8
MGSGSRPHVRSCWRHLSSSAFVPLTKTGHGSLQIRFSFPGFYGHAVAAPPTCRRRTHLSTGPQGGQPVPFARPR